MVALRGVDSTPNGRQVAPARNRPEPQAELGLGPWSAKRRRLPRWRSESTRRGAGIRVWVSAQRSRKAQGSSRIVSMDQLVLHHVAVRAQLPVDVVVGRSIYGLAVVAAAASLQIEGSWPTPSATIPPSRVHRSARLSTAPKWTSQSKSSVWCFPRPFPGEFDIIHDALELTCDRQ